MSKRPVKAGDTEYTCPHCGRPLYPVNMSVLQAARVLGVSKQTVYREIDEGKLVTVRIRGVRKIPSRVLRAYQAGRLKDSLEKNFPGDARAVSEQLRLFQES